MKTLLKVVGGLILLVLVAAGAGFVWAKSAAATKLARTFEVHTVDFPIPFPLTDAEVEALREERAAAQAPADADADGEVDGPAAGGGADPSDADADDSAAGAADPLAGVDLDAIALERAIARGKHLVEARYGCIECHGKNFGGGVMVDDAAMGQLLGPNITAGAGGKTKDYVAADWDRIVRHGVKPSGLPAAMPSEDFQMMSDQELSDIIAYVRTAPPVDNEVAPVSLGPLGTVLMATGGLPLSADVVSDHHKAHEKLPPDAAANAEFGRHLAGVCTGCHRSNFEGGPIAVGPPDWPPARNVTLHEEGLKGWTFEQFDTVLRTGKRPDGSDVLYPMSMMAAYGQKMEEVEMRALWAYVGSLPAVPTGR